MDERKAMAALREVARIHGVPLEVVTEEIELVIKQGLASPDPTVRSRWEQIPHKGECPTAGEVVAHLARAVLAQRR